MSEEDVPIIVEYRSKGGELMKFDISRVACDVFGFYYNDRVETPKGAGTVIGVREGCMWFHLDCDKGASFWDNGKNYEDLLHIGINLLPPPIEFTERKGYKLKKISFQNKNINIILQNENGPCPLISIGNVLALRGDIVFDDASNFLEFDGLLDRLSAYLYSKHFDKGPEIIEHIEKVIKLLPPLQYGLDVNFNFQEYDNFEKTDQCKLLDYFSIRLVHGWLVDPKDAEAHKVCGLNTYNDLMNKLVALDTPPNTSCSNTPSTPTQPSNNDEPPKKEEAPKPPTEQDFKDGGVIREFLNGTRSQLTQYGLSVLQNNISEGELCVFFRNNHFSTLTKHQNALYILVTDIGYERERNIVWDSLSSVDGSSSVFFTSEFKNTDQVNREEVVNTLELMGFMKTQIDQCLAQIPKEDLSNTDNAISRALQILNKGSEEQQPHQVQTLLM